ncbi:MAG: amidohydrolase family protein [Vampirovibrionales bacterium]|nr:amidohydrolase family protein [Vampirovibrionales bacterium]
MIRDSQTGWQWVAAHHLYSAPPNDWQLNHAVAWDTQGIIRAVSALDALPEALAKPLAQTLDALAEQGQHAVLTPGLVNCHTHTALNPTLAPDAFFNPPQASTQCISAGSRPKIPFTQWLLQAARWHRKQSPATLRARVQHSLRAIAASGTTCINDICSIQDAPVVLDTLAESGLRAIVSLEWFHPWAPVNLARLQTVADQITGIAQQWAAHPRIQIGISPHAPYNVNPFAWQWLQTCLAQRGLGHLPWHTHWAESPKELAWLNKKPDAEHAFAQLHQRLLGKPPGQTLRWPAAIPPWHDWLKEQTLLSPVTILAHGSLLNPKIWRYLQQRPEESEQNASNKSPAPVTVSIAHCFRSNLALHGVTLNWQALAQTGAATHAIALGTDSLLSCPDLDLRAEARAALTYHQWPQALAPAILTRHGAHALGKSHVIGKLEPGFQADAVLWLAPCSQTNAYTPDAMFLSPQTQAKHVWVSGQLLNLQ